MTYVVKTLLTIITREGDILLYINPMVRTPLEDRRHSLRVEEERLADRQVENKEGTTILI